MHSKYQDTNLLTTLTATTSCSPPEVRCGLAAQALGITMNAHSESASQVAPGGWKLTRSTCGHQAFEKIPGRWFQIFLGESASHDRPTDVKGHEGYPNSNVIY